MWLRRFRATDTFISQSTFAGGGGNWGNGDCILAKLNPARTITVDPAETYQTINGWEMVAFALEPDNPAFPNFKDTLFDLAVHDAGINRLRLEVRSGVENSNDNWSAHQDGTIEYQTWRSRRYATVNDNADPDTINWDGYHFSEMDDVIERRGFGDHLDLTSALIYVLYLDTFKYIDNEVATMGRRIESGRHLFLVERPPAIE